MSKHEHPIPSLEIDMPMPMGMSLRSRFLIAGLEIELNMERGKVKNCATA